MKRKACILRGADKICPPLCRVYSCLHETALFLLRFCPGVKQRAMFFVPALTSEQNAVINGRYALNSGCSFITRETAMVIPIAPSMTRANIIPAVKLAQKHNSLTIYVMTYIICMDAQTRALDGARRNINDRKGKNAA